MRLIRPRLYIDNGYPESQTEPLPFCNGPAAQDQYDDNSHTLPEYGSISPPV